MAVKSSKIRKKAEFVQKDGWSLIKFFLIFSTLKSSKNKKKVAKSHKNPKYVKILTSWCGLKPRKAASGARGSPAEIIENQSKSGIFGYMAAKTR